VVAIASDPKILQGGARGINLRMIAGQSRGAEARYAISLYLQERGDDKLRSIEDLYACTYRKPKTAVDRLRIGR
jgi:hypothetical protein